jgi:hypothetical protein
MRTTRCIWGLALFLAPQLAAQTPQNRYYLTRNDPTLRLIDAVPSYSARWFDREGEFHASLVNLRDSSRLRVLIDSIEPNRFAGEPRPHPSKGIIIEKARYSYVQLFNWKCELGKASIGVIGFQGIGVSGRTDQVRMGVTKPEAVEKVRRIVKSLKIPLNAVRIEVEEEMRML